VRFCPERIGWNFRWWFEYSGGQVTNFTMVARDISERLKLEAQIAQTNKMEALGRLAGGVAHDFNNLLQVIHGYSELTQTELPPDHASLNNLAQISTATGRAADLVRQLLTFSRREAFKPLALDVNDLLADLMKMIARLIGEQVDVIVRPGDSLPAVSADPAQLRQVLINLCVNARDAMPDGGRLLVTTSAVELDERFCAEHRLPRAGTYVQIEVSDNGTGIPPAVRERIFEPFFTTKEVGKGTGLGLATVYGIMRQHDGLVLLDSEVGSGTTVRVFFPGAELPLDAVEQTAGAPAAPGLSRTVLLAEDERQVRDLTIQVLQRAGYRVIATSDGQEALKAFEQHAGIIDLALLDFVMPKMGGNKVRERLRSLRADLPILFATGYGSDLLLRGFVPSSRERLLSKPWTAQQLLKAIHELLEESQPPRAP
jgi:signal transduction histidine kinase/ActR/RegA family two-component response regulator